METLDIFHGISGKSGQCPLILWTKSKEPKQTGQCRRIQWTLSTVSLHVFPRSLSMDDVHGIHVQCALTPWTMSMDKVSCFFSIPILQQNKVDGLCTGIPWTCSLQMDNACHLPLFEFKVDYLHGFPRSLSMDDVHGIRGQCLWTPWTLSMDKVCWFFFIPILDQNNVHGQCTGIPWKVYRLITSMDSLDHCQWMMSMDVVVF